MKVMIIPEDFQNDQYILKPLFTRSLRSIGASSVEIRMCYERRFRGVDQALTLESLAGIVRQFGGMIDIFVLCVDRDGVVGRRQRLDQIEDEFQDRCVFFGENAWEEIETWVLAGLELPSDWRWSDVRAEVDVKERYFEPLAALRGLTGSLGRGRKALGEEASRRVRAIRQKCPEDFDSLARRLETALQMQA